MFIHTNFSALPTNSLFNTNRLNQNASKQAAALKQVGGVGLRMPRDTVSLSPYGKANSALSGLEKLKQQIEDRKSEFLSKAAEKGKSAEEIQAQLESFDQQIKDIDKQILQMTIQRTNETIEKEKHSESTSIKRPKTRQEVENERLADITSMSAGLDKAEAVHSVKTQVDGDIGIKESEIALEESRGRDTKQLEEELAELRSQSNQLLVGVSDQLNETLEEIKESNDKVTDADIVDKEEAQGKDDKTENKVENDPTPEKAETKDQPYKTADHAVSASESAATVQSSADTADEKDDFS